MTGAVVAVGAARDWLRDQGSQVKLVYQPYDWGLNGIHT